jgi:two-component system, sensor histidine kinase and response regulator
MNNARRDTRLLLVEDNVTNQEIALRILQHLGYENVEVAGDGKQALAALAARDFDLVLMDCHLPDMDGYETSREIRRHDSAVRNHDIPIVATTAAAMDSDQGKCFAAGMNGYVAKPLRFAALEQAIQEWTGAVRTASPPPAELVAPKTAKAMLFDPDQFAETVMGNGVLARRIIRKFVDDMPRQLALLAQAVGDGDAPRVRLVAHSIKGAAASVSGPEIREASWKLEQQGRDGNLTGARGALVELSASFERARPVMESFGREDSDDF